ncbi:lytic transglycosylase domain-containing protein [Sphingomonas abietis]|uniref:Lytic transglycosylase domain-containing protein n=1 Tax=Sphingomonas abietis TaxID=3012344 RepID=A0ABY7NRY4_9SPHN|nr:lytic transglycosylase domain-containing protein [Sphingomonas abietis]WBO24297.1 lytic transglycosylase domain-containing protein [Sphingomonas abietis]
MVALIAAAVSTLLLASVPANAARDIPYVSLYVPPASFAVTRWGPLISQAANRFNVPEAWIAAVMEAESGGRTSLNGRPITSRAGAMGLMQLMPRTWEMMRREHHLGDDPYDTNDNILAGAAWLRVLADRFGYPGLFAAYNAGPARYAEHLRSGTPLPKETRRYIASLTQMPATASTPTEMLPETGLFFALGDTKGVRQSPVHSPNGGASNTSDDGTSAPPDRPSGHATRVAQPAARAGLFISLSTMSGGRR